MPVSTVSDSLPCASRLCRPTLAPSSDPARQVLVLRAIGDGRCVREPLRSTVLAMRAAASAPSAGGTVTLSTIAAVGAALGLLLGGYACITCCLRVVCGRALRGIGDARAPPKQLVEITPRVGAPHAQPSS